MSAQNQIFSREEVMLGTAMGNGRRATDGVVKLLQTSGWIYTTFKAKIAGKDWLVFN